MIRHILIFIFLLICGFFSEIHAAEPDTIFIGDNIGRYDPVYRMYLYEDTSGGLSLSDILSRTDQFRKNEWDYPAYGFTKSAIWGKIILQNQSGNFQNLNLLFDFPLLDEIEVYLLSKGRTETVQSGNRVHLSKKPYPFRQNIIPFRLNKNEKLTIYFRVKSSDTLELPLLIFNEKGLIVHYYRNMLILGLYYGIVFVMIFYNLFIYFSVRDRTYLYYVLLGLFISLTQFGLDGFTYQYLSPENLTASKRLHAFFGSSGIVSGLVFAIYYLNIKERSIRYYRLLSGLIFLTIVFLIYSMYDYSKGIQLVLSMAFFASIFFFIIGVTFYRSYRPARYFLIAMLFSMVGIIFLSLKAVDVYFPFLTRYGMQIGHVFEITLLSFALADRIRILQKDKDDILIDGLRREKEHQKNIHRMELLRVKNEVMEEDLDVARDIQMRLISNSNPERNLITLYHPMEKVGGDIIDLLPLSEDATGIFLGDVSGHGVPAALLSVMIKSFLGTKLAEIPGDPRNSLLYSPPSILRSLNDTLSEHLDNEFVSAFYGIYFRKERRLVYRSAGHPPPLIVYKDGVNQKTEIKFFDMKPQFFPIGSFFRTSKEINSSQVITLNLEPGMRIVFYSDGLLDAVNYTYKHSDRGIISFSNTFIYSWLTDAFDFTMDEWAGKLSEVLMDNRSKWIVEDDISAVFLEIK